MTKQSTHPASKPYEAALLDTLARLDALEQRLALVTNLLRECADWLDEEGWPKMADWLRTAADDDEIVEGGV